MKVLVTGAGGFIGANLTHRLAADGHAVVALERPGGQSARLKGVTAERVELDLRDADAVEEIVRATAPDWVFHLAAHGAYSWQSDPRSIFESNVLGTVNVACACVASGCEVFVQAGSSSEYGFFDHAPSEDEILRPNSHYAVSKAAATLHVGHIGRASGRRFITLRLYSVYGPWEDSRRLVPTLIECGLRNSLPALVQPDVARDLVHVDDVVDAFLRVPGAESVEPGGIYNVGSGTQKTVKEIVEVACEVLDVTATPVWESMPNRAWDTHRWIADPRKAARDLGWRAQIDLRSGFERTVAWTRAQSLP